jgi:hypothetical protein
MVAPSTIFGAAPTTLDLISAANYIAVSTDLLAAVQPLPHLYDKRNGGHKVRTEVDNGWISVSDGLNERYEGLLTTPDMCKSQWSKLKALYATAKSRQQRNINKSGNAPIAQSTFPFYAAMGFLDAFNLRRRTIESSAPVDAPLLNGPIYEQLQNGEYQFIGTHEEKENASPINAGQQRDDETMRAIMESGGEPLVSARAFNASAAVAESTASLAPDPKRSKRSRDTSPSADQRAFVDMQRSIVAQIDKLTSAPPPSPAVPVAPLDKHDVYGQHVALVLRGLLPNDRAKARRAINKVLDDLEVIGTED